MKTRPPPKHDNTRLSRQDGYSKWLDKKQKKAKQRNPAKNIHNNQKREYQQKETTKTEQRQTE